MKPPSTARELFPELAIAVPEKPARKPRAAKPQPQTRAAAPAAAANPVQEQAQAADSMEVLARQLEAHADFRVLRRLRPRLDWPGQATGKLVRMVLLDTETTGLDQSKESVIELALLRVDIDAGSGLPVGRVQVYDGLEDPGKPIPPEVVALTGIQDADVQGHTLDEARVAELLDGVDLIVAHNAGFDRPFVERRLDRFAQIDWACSFADIDWKAQGCSSAKLESLAQSHGWFYEAHRAEMDCHALLAVLAQPLPAAAHTGLAQLLQSVKSSTFGLQATHAPFEAKDKLKARGYRWNAEQRVWHTRLKDAAALSDECEWLKAQVYGGRRALVQVEEQDARVRFSSRPGVIRQHPL